MRPPRFSRWMLAVALAPQDRRFALADLDEELEDRAEQDGHGPARRWYRRQVARSVAPLLRRRVLGGSGSPPSPKPPKRAPTPDLTGDVRYAARKLVQAPVVVLTTVLSLGLGIGVATTVFTVANATLLRSSLGTTAEIDGLTALYTSGDFGGANGSTSFPDYLSMVEATRQAGDEAAFDELMAYRMGMVNLEGADADERLMVEIVTGNYFEVLGVRMPLGRGFTAQETALGAADPVVVLSYRVWRDRFASDPLVLGEVLTIDGVPFTVIGVAPEGLNGRFLAIDVDAWLPLGIPGGTYHATPTELADRDDREYGVMGRLAEGATIERAQAQMAALGASLHEEHGAMWQDDVGQQRRITVLSEPDSRVPPDARAGLFGLAALLLLITGMILFMACSNVAGMFLARANHRQREMAIRLALGASRRRLVRMLMIESLILGLLSGAVGMVLAWQASAWLEVLPFPMGISLRFDFSLDYRVLLFCVLVSTATSVVFGLVPALEASKPALTPALAKSSGVLGRRPGRFSLRNVLVMGQVAVSLVFLVAAGLLLRTLQVSASTDIGIHPQGIASMTKFLPESDYPGEAAGDYFDQLEARLTALPEVDEVHTTLTAEMSIISSIYGLEIEVDGYENAEGHREMIAYNAVTPGYMEMMGIELLRGRTVAATDRRGGSRVAVVSESFAGRYWPEENPLGKTFTIVGRRGARNRMQTAPEMVRVVGLVADGSYAGLGSEESPFAWMPITQDRTPYRFIHVRARSGTAAGVAVLRDHVPLERREVSLIQPTAYEELIGFQYFIMAAASQALGYCGVFALILAAVGIYGIVSYAVSQRRHEMAVRRALGAVPRQVLALVVRDGMSLAAIGLAVGLFLALPISVLVAADFAELSPVDPIAVGGSIAVLLAVALAATVIPARRVTRIDPMNALREE